ncbi:type 1 fimbrial protein [Proteus alimentorum]|uniref:Type 1 fimbrial protein n=1 Tax=Proteus alimentorum TaxID=1973495 RepID=A0ABS0IQ10_9GAMM|nr:fimbrial protein [Proteus alimentorum]MBG2876469.1 type 1 fimbrial protein [Proteus alimentorum]MBG2878082.1 type 1 fimbrial protein [Proteus alimentorum]
MRKVSLITALVFAAISTNVIAADGKITFNGEIVKQSCTVEGGNKDKTVTLPKVSAVSLKEAGNVTGTTPFTIELSNCNASETITDVGLSFVGPNIDLNTKTLKTEGIGATTAKNVNIALYNQDDNLIKLGLDKDDQNVQYAKIASDKAQLNYFARYYALGQAEPGLVETNVDFEIIYK